VRGEGAKAYSGKVGEPVDGHGDGAARCARFHRHDLGKDDPGDGGESGAESEDKRDDGYGGYRSIMGVEPDAEGQGGHGRARRGEE
jgi:hypothetical protein